MPPFRAAWEACQPGIEVCLDDGNQAPFHGNRAILVAFAVNLHNTTVLGRADVANVGADQLVGP
jgi:hypothetical protein